MSIPYNRYRVSIHFRFRDRINRNSTRDFEKFHEQICEKPAILSYHQETSSISSKIENNS